MFSNTFNVLPNYLLCPLLPFRQVASTLLTSRKNKALPPIMEGCTGPAWRACLTLAKSTRKYLQGQPRPPIRRMVASVRLKLPQPQINLVNLVRTHRSNKGPFTSPAPLEPVLLQIRKPLNGLVKATPSFFLVDSLKWHPRFPRRRPLEPGSNSIIMTTFIR